MWPRRGHIGPVAIVLGACALLWAVLTVPASAGSTARVLSPTTSAGDAVVRVYVGGDRATATTVAPVRGVRLGLFRDEPPQTSFGARGTTDVAPLLTCVSLGDGSCTFRVPVGAEGTPPGARLWVAPVSMPTGWFSAPAWETGPAHPTSADPRVATPHLFQTPPLHAGSLYASGQTYGTAAFMGDPATPATPSGAGVGPGDLRRLDSGGLWALSRTDPPLTRGCGLDVAIIADLSGSAIGHVAAIRRAATDVVASLTGTPSQAALVTVGDSSPAVGFGPNTPLLPLATTEEADRFTALLGGWHSPRPSGANWDAGLQAAAVADRDPDPSQHLDLAVLITAGDPSRSGPDPAPGQAARAFTDFRTIEDAAASADRLKAAGTRVLAVHVGQGKAADSAVDLRSVAGTGPGDVLLPGDDAAALRTALAGPLDAACAGSISVVQRIVPAGAATTADAYTPSQPWVFSATPSISGLGAISTTGSTAIGTGAVSLRVAPSPAGGPESVAVLQHAPPGYALFPTDGSGGLGLQNADCTDAGAVSAPVAVPVSDSTDGFSLVMGPRDAVTCVVYDRAPGPDTSQVVVHEQWRITDVGSGRSATYRDGFQPPALQAHMRLAAPGSGRLVPQQRDQVRAGYDPAVDRRVAVRQTVHSDLPGCRLVGARLSGDPAHASRPMRTGAVAGHPRDGRATAAVRVIPGRQAWTVTDDVACTSRLTLRAESYGGPVAARRWMLAATGAGPRHRGRTGQPAVTGIAVAAGRRIRIVEKPGREAALHEFVQDSVSTAPSGGRPGHSRGAWDCAPPRGGGDRSVVDGVVRVPLGAQLICTGINRTASVTVVTRVHGGVAVPSDWTFYLTPVGPLSSAAPRRSLSGPGRGGTILVRPGQTYSLREIGSPASYQLTDVQCTVDGRVRSGAEVTVPAGAHAACAATHTYAAWTVVKSSNPSSGSSVRPGMVITYTLTARALGGAPAQGVQIADDLSAVLAHAAMVGVDPPSAGTIRLSGNTLTWHLPSLAGVQTVSYRVRVGVDSVGVALAAMLSARTTLEPGGGGDEAVPCVQAPGAQPGCYRSDHLVIAAAPAAATDLPDTGGPQLALVVGGALLMAFGLLLLTCGRRRSRT